MTERRTNSGYDYRERIGPATAGTTLLEHLALRHAHSPAAAWHARIDAGLVLVGGAPARTDRVLRPGDVVTWRRPAWIEPDAPLAFAILYRDAWLVAVAKPSGLPTLPGGGFLENTLLHRVRAAVADAAPLHRLGRSTSGLVLFARTPDARARIVADWNGPRTVKRYRALLGGAPASDAFEVSVPIGPVPYAPLGTLHAATAAGRPARSRFRVVERRDGEFLADVFLDTGRPHQIRIHAAAAGHPLVGDPLYAPGGLPHPDGTAVPGDPGYRLHAAELRLVHPHDGRPLVLACAPPPALRPSGGAGLC